MFQSYFDITPDLKDGTPSGSFSIREFRDGQEYYASEQNAPGIYSKARQAIQGGRTDPFRLYEGGVQQSKEAIEPSIISTDDFRTQAQIQLKKLEDQAKEIQSNIQKQEQAKTAGVGKQEGVVKQEETLTPEEMVALGITPEQNQQKQLLKQQSEEMRKEKETLDEQLTQLEVKADANTAALINSIKANFETRRRQMEDINVRSQGVIEQLGIRTGAARRAGSFTGIMSAEERAGVQRLADLDRQEGELILAAEEAARTNKFNILSKRMTELDKKREEKNKEIIEFNKAVAEKNKEIIENSYKQAQTAKTLVEVADAYAENLAPYLSSMLTGDPETDSSLIQGVAKTHKLDPLFLAGAVEKYQGERDKDLITSDYKNYILQGGKMGDAAGFKQFMETKKAGDGVGGVGGDVGYKQFTDEQIALSAIPTQLRNTEKELNRYLQGIRLGMQEQQARGEIVDPYKIADDLIGYKVNKPDDFSKSLRQVLSVGDSDNKYFSEVARLINAGEKEKAMLKAEESVYRAAKLADPEGFIGEPTVRTAVTKSNQILEALKKVKESPIGVVKGTMEQWLGRFKSKDAQQIQTLVTEAVKDMRNRLSGTAVTASEGAFLTPIIPSLSDSPENFMIKLNNLKNAPLTQLNSIRSTKGIPELNEDNLINTKSRLNLYAAPTKTKAESMGYDYEKMIADGYSDEEIKEALEQ